MTAGDTVHVTTLTPPGSSNPTERQAGEPVIEFFQYGSLRRVVGVAPFAPSQLPRVSFGLRTGMDDAASAHEAGLHSLPGDRLVTWNRTWLSCIECVLTAK
jgi:hypothetical protein